MKIAYLGLGIMGRPMASNLIKAGHEVTVWNRTPKNLDGARTAATAAEAARDAEVVWMCVADTKAVESVLFGPEGVEASLRPGLTVVDSSTISPKATREFAARVRAKGAEFVDAPVTGFKNWRRERRNWCSSWAGRRRRCTSLEPLFMAMGKKVIHVGETGAGESAKIGMNLMIASIFEGFAEALALTGKLGVPAEKLVELIQVVDDPQRSYRLQGQLRAEAGLVAEFSPAADAEGYPPDAGGGSTGKDRVARAAGDREGVPEGGGSRTRQRRLCVHGRDGEKPEGRERMRRFKSKIKGPAQPKEG